MQDLRKDLLWASFGFPAFERVPEPEDVLEEDPGSAETKIDDPDGDGVAEFPDFETVGFPFREVFLVTLEGEGVLLAGFAGDDDGEVGFHGHSSPSSKTIGNGQPCSGRMKGQSSPRS